MIIGVDVGGTFTDVVGWDGISMRSAKVPTTIDQSDGVIAGARRVGDRADVFLHGTTIATNALLEHKGARVLLVTDEGFEDIIEIGRQDRPSLYEPFADRPAVLVASRDRTAVVTSQMVDGVESAAVSLLRSYEDARAEREVRSGLAELAPDLPVSLSSEVSPEFREFERTSTTVLNAYLAPVVSAYLDRLATAVVEGGFAGSVSVMRSSGGAMPASDAARLPVAILLSGPAGGAVAAAEFGSALGHDHVISFDMGGTSTDVCRIRGGTPEVTFARSIGGYACQMPAASIHTVGAGGGSIAWSDAGGSLRVGPESAGAMPGPACYGRGGVRATVTDANVVLGRIGGDVALGGDLHIDPGLSVSAVARLAADLGIDRDAAALGIVRVVEENMTGAVRTVSVEQGADPREAHLVAFGGAGGLHATALARNLDMAGVLIPPHGGVFSALGLLLSSPRVDRWRSAFVTEEAASRLDEALVEIARAALVDLAGGTVSTAVDVRYVGQSHELTIGHVSGDGWDRLSRRFHDEHRLRNGFSRDEDPVEVVTVRASVVGDPPLTVDDLPIWVSRGDARRGTRPVRTDAGVVEADVWWRDGLSPGDVISGPALIDEREATSYLAAGEQAVVHSTGTLVVEW